MRTLIIADVHANFPAFEAVVNDAGHWDDVVFLGDIVGYGPHPEECTKLLRELDPVTVKGNHDHIIADMLPTSFIWDLWTRERLSEESFRYISSFPYTRLYGDVRLIHRSPKPGYLRPTDPAEKIAEAYSDFSENELWYGHSHHLFEREFGSRKYICFRSVGQSRDHDTRAGYAILENGVITYHNAPYDVERTAFDTAKIPLEEDFKTKWLAFLRTGYDKVWSII